jgi:hypothetical protein
VRDDGELRREPKPAQEVARQPTTRARDFENQTGQKSGQRVAIDEAAGIMRRARSWEELHVGLAGEAMRFERKGSGAILWVDDVAVKASTAGRNCSMSALEKRLGEYAPPPPDLQVRPRAPQPLDPGDAEWEAYAAERKTHFRDKTERREQLREQHLRERESTLGRHRTERRECLELDWRGRGAELNAVRSMLAARQAQEKAEIRERQKVEFARHREQRPRWPTFETWLREQRSPERAERWRFRDRKPALIVGDRDDLARPRDIRAFTGEPRGWEVAYRRSGSHEAPSFIDRGGEIRIHDLQRDSVLAALQLSAQKWGTFHVFGSDDYKRLCVGLAAEHGFRVANPELQQDIAAAREERQRQVGERSIDIPRPRTRGPTLGR